MGGLTATDDGDAEDLTFEVVGAAADLFEVVTTANGPVLSVKAGANLDAETTASVAVEVQATDAFGETTSTTVNVAIANVSEFDTLGADETFLEGNINYGGVVRFENNLTDADNGEDGADFASETYIWFLDGEVVEGVTGDVFETTEAMAGQYLSASLTVVDQAGESTTIEEEFGHILPRYWEGDTPIVINVNADTLDGLEAFGDNILVAEDAMGVFGQNLGSLFGSFEDALDSADGYFVELESTGELSFNFLYDDGTGNLDSNGSELEIRFGDLDTQTFDDLNAIVAEIQAVLAEEASEILATDFLANTSLAGTIEDIIFESTAGQVQLTSWEGDPGEYDGIDIKLRPYDEEGEDVVDPDLIRTLSVRGEFDTGLQTLRDLVEDLDETYEDANAADDVAEGLQPDYDDYVDGEGTFDYVGYDAAWVAAEAAWQEADALYEVADEQAIETFLETFSPAGLRASYFEDAEGNREQAFYANFFDSYTDGDGVEKDSVYVEFGDYFFFAEGDFPDTFEDVLGVLEAGFEIMESTDDLATLFNGTDELPGLIDAGLASVDFIGFFERGEEDNTRLFSIEFNDFEGLVTDDLEDLDFDGEAYGSYPEVTFGDDDAEPTDLGYAYDNDGVYIVLGEGLDFDAFDAVLSELSLSDAIAA